ncbi:hypothetical protein DFJ68_3234 [Terracoccus luteus]|uniref:Uncharacterized protein n=1 Tax=Terracoccus luteus TaxID=53356 RepID=A0A495Y3E4_9MICO|nr:hypothetical protein [Terracoccus luteus]RKT79756.1 hypothetical protein DFJ68_3234 [Terracoccus luteus]
MTYSQPRGYRLSTDTSLTSVSRALERFGWPLWQVEIRRAVAAVCVELLADDDRDTVFRKLSHGQVGDEDLVVSAANRRGLLHRAAEFLDVGHGIMHRPSALPLPPRLDLRCRAQFMDDRDDPVRRYTYVLFGTEHERLEEVFLQLRGIEAYPLASGDDPVDDDDAAGAGAELAERAAVWDRVLAPYARFSPLSISAPEPQVTFDVAESLHWPDREDEFAAQGKTTVTQVVAEVARRLGDTGSSTEADADVRARLLAPIG